MAPSRGTQPAGLGDEIGDFREAMRPLEPCLEDGRRLRQENIVSHPDFQGNAEVLIRPIFGASRRSQGA